MAYEGTPDYEADAKRILEELEAAAGNPVDDPVEYVRERIQRLLTLAREAAAQCESLEGTIYDGVGEPLKNS